MDNLFYKYHGLGNDYIVIDPKICAITMNKNNIMRICDRNFGVGSDGILYGPFWNEGVIGVKIYNPDGSEAEKSGNGIRIFSRYLKERNYIKSREYILRTLGGEVMVTYLDDAGERTRVNMGKPSFSCEDIPAIFHKEKIVDEELLINGEQYRMTCVSLGNPHCVIRVPEVSKSLACILGPNIENNHIFPNKINMQLLQIVDRDNINIEIWERGAQYTLASGSSSCAAATVAHNLGLVNDSVCVHMPGGSLQIDFCEGNVYMVGNVSSIMSGKFSADFLRKME